MALPWSFCVVLDHLLLEWIHPLQICDMEALCTLILLLLKHHRKSCNGFTIRNRVLLCTQMGHPVKLLCPFLAWLQAKEWVRNLQDGISRPWSKGHLPHEVSHSMCLQMSLHAAVLTRALQGKGAVSDGLEACALERVTFY